MAIKDIEENLPFNLLGFASDNGNEFINENLLNYFQNRHHHPVEFVRRRPYKKNDNAHVEQKKLDTCPIYFWLRTVRSKMFN
jgi:hypothetical protein